MIFPKEDNMTSQRPQRKSHNRRNQLNPSNVQLQVQGMPLTPNRSYEGSEEDLSSNRTSISASEDELVSDNSYTALDGLRDINHGLLKQIDTLRMKIQVDEKNHNISKQKIEKETDTRLESKDCEIEDLQESLTKRDERIHQLEKTTNAKDKDIQTKCQEIESLKKVVKRTQEYARRLNQAITKIKTQRQTGDNESLKEKDEEIRKLNGEMELLQSRFYTLEEEMKRAMNIIEEQNGSIKALREDREEMYAKFRDDLAKEKQIMRDEIARTRELMHQQFKEVIALREQNQTLCEDIRFIRDCLQKQQEDKDKEEVDERKYPSRQPIQAKSMSISLGQDPYRPRSSSKQPTVENPRARVPSGKSSARTRNESARLSYPQSPYNESQLNIPPDTSRSSPDRSARAWTGKGSSTIGRLPASFNSSHPNTPQYSSRENAKNFPPIAGLREGTVTRGARSGSSTTSSRRGYLSRR